ncbi:MAG: hypothetical protein QM780_09245 [Hyphomicrobium sp.]|uniref:hypothetical protein n=1 Tax=Hyphomicrobium sp. TaxID=82 RepID=UPI0039E326AD
MSELKAANARRREHIIDSYMDQRMAQDQRRAFPRAVSKRHQSSVPSSFRKKIGFTLVVVAALTLVHVSQALAEDQSATTKLPPHVADLRDVILTAARSGNIDELKSAFEVSGNVPDLGISPRSDPIRVLKDRSADPQGRDTLAAIVSILELPPAALPLGNDIENNLIYVWPGLSTRPIEGLTPPEQVDLYRLVSPELVAEMRKKRRWLWWRLVIAADGSWTLFRKGD